MNAPDRDEQRQQEERERQALEQEQERAILPRDQQFGEDESTTSPVIINR